MRALLTALVVLVPSAALADSASSLGPRGINEATGAAIYQHVCQGCHMPGGAGAVGAAAFPRLAGNHRLAAAGYPIAMVLRGNGAMPWFNGQLSDAQIADVINYVRTHFGNSYTDAVTPERVAAAHGPAPVLER